MSLSVDFVTALKRNDRQGAVAIARAMLAQGAPLGDQWRAIAQFAANSREWSVAIAAARKFLAIDPQDVARILTTGGILAEAGRLDDAIALVEPAWRAHPADGRLAHLLGTVHLQAGDRGKGLALLEAAVRLLPNSGPTWLAIAGATDYADDDKGLLALRDAGRRFANVTPDARACYLYALGKALADRGETGPAFAAYAEGARLARAVRPYDRAADVDGARRIAAGFTKAWLDGAAMDCREASVPAFVTGLPRSGTTLVEQMLASHPAFGDGGELNLLGMAAEAVGGSDPAVLPARFDAARGSDAAWGPARALYLHLIDERRQQPGRVIDKSLNTSRFAGLVRLALPDAPIVWLRRDPLDVAWSSFRTHFQTGLGWSFSLEDMGWHFAAEDFLFEHWRDAIGAQMLVVPYAELVRDPEDWAQKIIGHCGLPFDPAMLDFHRTRRTVATASVDQVRRPIYRDSVGSAAAYAPMLQPFVDAYAAGRKALGLPPA